MTTELQEKVNKQASVTDMKDLAASLRELQASHNELQESHEDVKQTFLATLLLETTVKVTSKS